MEKTLCGYIMSSGCHDHALPMPPFFIDTCIVDAALYMFPFGNLFRKSRWTLFAHLPSEPSLDNLITSGCSRPSFEAAIAICWMKLADSIPHDQYPTSNSTNALDLFLFYNG